jgi:glycosyltransferase involved in cell wall biosynthesis
MVARSCPYHSPAGTKLEQVSRQGDNLKDIAGKRNTGDLICLSHLRWNFVFQRPQHLMTRFARTRRVFFFEEPIFDVTTAELRITRDHGVFVCVPHIPTGLTTSETTGELRRLIDELVSANRVERPIIWYYTPMALAYARHLSARVIVFDCMDELSAFRGAPPELLEREHELLGRADVVFTGGQSLYEAKRDRHRRVFAFPSSVDVPHFAAARLNTVEPPDQATIPRPRLGFFGVVDERIELELIRAVAKARPDWHLVILGPCVKIDPATLPQSENLHYLGMKAYADLPQYLSGWDVALLPFARNESTQFISPTKTPEYLAAGCPVVSTAVRDVVRPYGERGFVSIADTAEEFIAAIDRALTGQSPEWREEVDRFLGQMSWDRTWDEMSRVIDSIAVVRAAPTAAPITVPDTTQRTQAAVVQPNL